jgi:hypothetical protein
MNAKGVGMRTIQRGPLAHGSAARDAGGVHPITDLVPGQFQLEQKKPGLWFAQVPTPYMLTANGLEQHRISVKVQELPLTACEPTHIDNFGSVDAHSLE